MDELKRRLSECIDRGLSYLGENVKLAIYWYFERRFGAKKEDIPDRPEEFLKMLEEMYGVGARVIERVLAREISKEFGLQSQDCLIDAIRKAKSS